MFLYCLTTICYKLWLEQLSVLENVYCLHYSFFYRERPELLTCFLFIDIFGIVISFNVVFQNFPGIQLLPFQDELITKYCFKTLSFAECYPNISQKHSFVSFTFNVIDSLPISYTSLIST